MYSISAELKDEMPEAVSKERETTPGLLKKSGF
jgi:hypothetical protein